MTVTGRCQSDLASLFHCPSSPAPFSIPQPLWLFLLSQSPDCTTHVLTSPHWSHQSSRYLITSFSCTPCQFIVVVMLLSCLLILLSSFCPPNLNLDPNLPSCYLSTCLPVCLPVPACKLFLSINSWSHPAASFVCIWVRLLLPLSRTAVTLPVQSSTPGHTNRRETCGLLLLIVVKGNS